MLERNVTLPEIGLIAGTRAVLGAGVGLLIADKLSDDHRRTIGWTLFTLGALTTIPLVADLMLGHMPSEGQNGKLAPRLEGEQEPARTDD
jgi:hypothetical protein